MGRYIARLRTDEGIYYVRDDGLVKRHLSHREPAGRIVASILDKSCLDDRAVFTSNGEFRVWKLPEGAKPFIYRRYRTQAGRRSAIEALMRNLKPIMHYVLKCGKEYVVLPLTKEVVH